MKLAVLLLILSVVMIVFFRFFRKNKNLENKKEDIIDLEKDPESDEYKPKDDNFSIMLFNQRQYLMEPGWSRWWSNYFLPR